MALKSWVLGIIWWVKSPHQILGRNVSRLRNQIRLTQEELAEKAEISRGFLQEIEKGGKNPTINVTARLRKALQCSWMELLQGIE
jgi:transcriptional regulator with XRE-family HTH domain